MKNIIYMGQSGDTAVYYDVKRRAALEAPKSDNLDTNADKKVGGKVYLILFIVGFLGLIMRNMDIPPLILGTYTEKTLFFLGFVWLLEFIFVIFYVERRMYRHVKLCQPTDNVTYKTAIAGNTFWNSISDKIVARKHFIWSVFILGMILLPIIGGSFLVATWSSGNVEIKPGQYGFTNLSIGSEIIILSLLGFYFGGIYAIFFKIILIDFLKQLNIFKIKK